MPAIDYKIVAVLVFGTIGAVWAYKDHQAKAERLEFEKQRWMAERRDLVAAEKSEDERKAAISQVEGDLKRCEDRALRVSDRPENKGREGQAFDYLQTECRREFDRRMQVLRLQLPNH